MSRPRRSDPTYVLSDSNLGVVTSIDGLVDSALKVSNNDPSEALAFLHRNRADWKCPVMGQVIIKLSEMI